MSHYTYTVVTVNFSQTAYNATGGKVNIVLVLSKSLGTQPSTVNGSFVKDSGTSGM